MTVVIPVPVITVVEAWPVASIKTVAGENVIAPGAGDENVTGVPAGGSAPRIRISIGSRNVSPRFATCPSPAEIRIWLATTFTWKSTKPQAAVARTTNVPVVGPAIAAPDAWPKASVVAFGDGRTTAPGVNDENETGVPGGVGTLPKPTVRKSGKRC